MVQGQQDSPLINQNTIYVCKDEYLQFVNLITERLFAIIKVFIYTEFSMPFHFHVLGLNILFIAIHEKKIGQSKKLCLALSMSHVVLHQWVGFGGVGAGSSELRYLDVIYFHMFFC